MKQFKAILIIASLLLFYACGGSKKKSEVPIPGEKKLLAIYTDTDGIKKPGIVVMVITKTIKYDSLTKKDNIVIDTIWGRPVNVPLLDSLKRPVKDSLGQLKYLSGFALIGKDSVNWRIEGKSVDSLIKK